MARTPFWTRAACLGTSTRLGRMSCLCTRTTRTRLSMSWYEQHSGYEQHILAQTPVWPACLGSLESWHEHQAGQHVMARNQAGQHRAKHVLAPAMVSMSWHEHQAGQNVLARTAGQHVLARAPGWPTSMSWTSNWLESMSWKTRLANMSRHEHWHEQTCLPAAATHQAGINLHSLRLVRAPN